MVNLKKWMTKTLEQFKISNITYTPSNYSHLSSQSAVRKQGAIVHVYIGAVKDIGYATETVLFTLPDGCAPSREYQTYGIAGGSTLSTLVRFTFSTNGNVSAYNYNSSASDTINTRANITYITAGGNKLLYPFKRIAQILRRKEVGAC